MDNHKHTDYSESALFVVQEERTRGERVTGEARTPEQTIREALDAALDCKGPYMGTVSERGGDRAICPQCTAVVHRARLELAELADLRAELAAAREAMVKADRSFESIIVRCTEGDKRVNWLPTITGIAREARAALGAAPASPAEAPQAEPASDPEVRSVGIPIPPPIPNRIVLGANGAYWRAFDTEPALEGLYSMCPNSTDNAPVVPVMTFLPVTETGASLVAALQKHKDRIQALQELVCTCDSKHIFQAALHDETCPVRGCE